jgi:CubicO group peptidase (beta-lactamase class C family)
MHGRSMFERLCRRTAIVITVAANGLATTVAAQVPEAPAEVVAGELGAQIDGYLTRAAALGFAGAVLVARDGQVILHKGYGLADRERGIPVTTATAFDIGSITKPFTAAAILKLEEQGRLSVNDPIRHYLDGVPPDKAGITIHHLLTHSAGLRDAFGDDYDVVTRDSLVARVLASDLLWEPGVRYRYSNAGYSLLGAIIEKLSGRSYEAFLRDELFEPAGLTSTGYRLPNWPSERVAHGYRRERDWGTPLDKPWAEDGPYWHLRANGGLLSTVGDLYRWSRALEGEAVLTQLSRDKMFTPQVPEDDERTSFYGYGWAITPTTRGTNLIWHNGGNGYFFADFRRYVDEGVVLIFATNETVNREIERRVVRLLFGRAAEVEPLPAAGLTLPESQLARYAGAYALPAGAAFEVRVQNGQLVIPAEDPAVSAAFVAFPKLDDAARLRLSGIERVTETVVAGMAAGDLVPFQREFVRVIDVDIAGEIEFWRQAFQFWSDRLGPFTGSVVLGSARGASDFGPTLDTYVLAKFAGGSRLIAFRQSVEGPASGFYLETTPSIGLPAAHRFVPLSESEFATFDFVFAGEARIEFVIDPDGRVSALSVATGAGVVVAHKLR